MTGILASKAMQEKANRGVLPGAPPVGYINKRWQDITWIEIDRDKAPCIYDAFQLAVQNKRSLRQLLQIISEHGLRSRSGKCLGVSGLWNILTNPFYCGYVRYKGQLIKGKQIPIVSIDLFDRVQQMLACRRLNKKTGSKSG